MKIQDLTQPLNESVDHAIQWHQDNKVPLVDNIFRIHSPAWFEFFCETRRRVASGQVLLEHSLDRDMIESDLGTFGLYNGESVPLDCIFEEPTNDLNEAEYQGKTVELNKPKRGGPKKYYVYVKNPKTGNVKRIAFGDVSGLSVKIRDPKRRKAFADRHNCEQKTDKMTAGYWACRVPRYTKSLGLSPISAKWW
jgi:hypothetical protein